MNRTPSPQPSRPAGERCGALCLAWLLVSQAPGAGMDCGTNGLSEVGFSRLIHGWTNYSTGFNATHDLALDGDFATVASLYVPSRPVIPQEYAAIVVWLGDPAAAVDFTRFSFSVGIWSGLDTLIRNPRAGDLAHFVMRQPTGGSTTTPDAYTRGGRPAYELRFCLPQAPVLAAGQGYWIGFAAHADPGSSGELYVPTSSQAGPSDVQAGSLAPGGWLYLVDAGGSTIYDGRLAVELRILSPPSLAIHRTGDRIVIAWPETVPGLGLEAADQLGPQARWQRVDAEVNTQNGLQRVQLPVTGGTRYFRLTRSAILQGRGTLTAWAESPPNSAQP